MSPSIQQKTIGLFFVTLACFALSPAVCGYNLTGTWSADDGGLYYVRQLNDIVWWVGMSTESRMGLEDFRKGVAYTNVFRGRLTGDTIAGDWADVPRGSNHSNGTLTLRIVTAPILGAPVLQKQPPGGSGPSTWNLVIPTQTAQPSCDNIVASSRDIRCKFSKVRKNNGAGPTLLDGGDLKPYKDNVVMFGYVSEDLKCCYPAGASRSYTDFFNCFPGGRDCDGDINFNIRVDRRNLEAQRGFWTDGWLSVDPNEIKAKMGINDNDVHCEPIMYGRTGDPCSNGDSGKILLPGWMENGANAIFWNGTPINGNVDIYASGPVPTRIFNQNLPPGKHVRVTGVLVIDCGHVTCGPVDVSEPAGVEIHPVYSIDILQDWSFSRPNADLTGVWATSDGATYYVRQLVKPNTVWWLGLSRDQGRSFANIFHGSIRYRGDRGQPLKTPVVVGDWANVSIGENGPMNSGQLRLGGSFCLNPYRPDNFNISLPACDVSQPLPEWNILQTTFTNNGIFKRYRWLKLYDRARAAAPP